MNQIYQQMLGSWEASRTQENVAETNIPKLLKVDIMINKSHPEDEWSNIQI